MGKKILIRESQLLKIIETIREENDNDKAVAQAQFKDATTDISTNDERQAKPDTSNMAYLMAFEKFLVDNGLCVAYQNEGVLNEGDILQKLKAVFKKGVLIASAAIALGILTPQEAQAQTGHAGDPEIIKLFKKKGRDACDPNRGQGPLATSKQKPTSSVIIYKHLIKAPKFRTDKEGDNAGEYKYYVQNKSGDYKEISAKQVERIQKKHNISTKVIKGKDLKQAIRQNK